MVGRQHPLAPTTSPTSAPAGTMSLHTELASSGGGGQAADGGDIAMQQGQSDASIAALQRSLNALGYGPVPEDGMFGADTAQAVGMFQSDNGLPVTMAVDDATLNMITNALEVLSTGAKPIGTPIGKDVKNTPGAARALSSVNWLGLSALALGALVLFWALRQGSSSRLAAA